MWSLSIIVQIFLALPNNLLSTDARCLHSNYTVGRMQYGRFLPRDAMLSAVHAVVVYLSVHLSVCVSVTLRYCVKTSKRRITHIMRHDSNIL